MLMVRDNLKTLPERNPPPLRGSPRASTAPHTAVVGQFAGSMIACGARGALRLWLRTAPRSRPREDSPASPSRWSSRKLTHPEALVPHAVGVAGERAMPLFTRPDGTPVTALHPVRRIMPFLMPGRNEAFVLFEQQIDVAPARRFLAEHNAARPPDRAATLFHLVLRSIGLALATFPRLNRFVAGSRLYDRRGLWLSFSAKKRLKPAPPLFPPK